MYILIMPFDIVIYSFKKPEEVGKETHKMRRDSLYHFPRLDSSFQLGAKLC